MRSYGKLSFFISLNLPGSGRCHKFWLKHLQYRAKTCFNNHAVSRSHYDLQGIKHALRSHALRSTRHKAPLDQVCSAYCTEINQNWKLKSLIPKWLQIYSPRDVCHRFLETFLHWARSARFHAPVTGIRTKTPRTKTCYHGYAIVVKCLVHFWLKSVENWNFRLKWLSTLNLTLLRSSVLQFENSMASYCAL